MSKNVETAKLNAEVETANISVCNDIKLDAPHSLAYIIKLKEMNKYKKIISMSGKEY